jgi:hypothetical protein
VRLLLDENIPTAAVTALRSAGHDVVHVIELRLSPRTPDLLAAMLVDLMGDENRRWSAHFSVIERDRVRQRPLGPEVG